ncbi:hypothetical protein Bca52824_017933 [Brassica carinata]|uniref:RNase H type-1 domain-containing protein n=1 Tax=Brassica carinata TaxID=52824 RepID=A0A8X7VP10_BRACI|nr:hypothetical protein Bca52824_017933 [Brassica carinata]
MYKQDSVVDLTLKVKDLWFPNSQVWNAQMLFETFTEEDALRILQIKPSPTSQDTDMWGFTKDGCYTTQSAYRMLVPLGSLELMERKSSLCLRKAIITPQSTITKALEEADIWYQLLHNKDSPPTTRNATTTWEKPPSDVVKCNVGMAWVNAGPLTGSSWIVRDCQGLPLHHSRQALANSPSKRESDLKTLLWAVQAMGDLHHTKILFEASSIEVRQSLLNPLNFPDLFPLIRKILDLLHCFDKWTISHVSDQKNRVANAIAGSVISDTRTQSYVATGGPRWLQQMIHEDARFG